MLKLLTIHVSDAWQLKMESYRGWFLKDMKRQVDESLRPEKSKYKPKEQLFGIEGSFKTLSIDWDLPSYKRGHFGGPRWFAKLASNWKHLFMYMLLQNVILKICVFNTLVKSHFILLELQVTCNRNTQIPT